jgi:secondary thiamine-phosphate synthase enzyme
MKQVFNEIMVNTKGQGLYEFTEKTIEWLSNQQIKNGMLNINILHTSASLVIQENADPDVLYDLKNFFDKLAPMDNKLYQHTTEGKDDMPAHIKSTLTNNQLTLSFKDKKLMLGTWQGLYLFEHRLEEHTRVLSHHLIGE